VTVVVVVVAVPSLRQAVEEGVAGRAGATASSSEPGHAADAILDGSPAAPGNDWRARSGGSSEWIRLSWRSSRTISELSFALDGGDHRIASGALSFSDGSSLLVNFRAGLRYDAVFVARSVSWVKFTVVELARGSTAAGIAEVRVLGPGGTNNLVQPASVTSDAEASASSSAAGHPAAALADGDLMKGRVGSSWLSNGDGVGAWAQLTWTRSYEISSVQIAGSAGGASIVAGTLQFSDGSSVQVGAIEEDPAYPTTVAFMPRVTHSVRFTIDAVDGTGGVSIGEIGAYPVGATPPRAAATTAVQPLPQNEFPAGCPASADATVPTGTIAVLCPSSNSKVADRVTIVLQAPGLRRIEAQLVPGDQKDQPAPVEITVPANGKGTAKIDVSALPVGPFTIRLQGYADATDLAALPVEGALAYLQLYHDASSAAITPRVPPSPQAMGKTLSYDEEFSASPSASPTGNGADYAASKPSYRGADEFGEAIFADPNQGLGTMTVLNNDMLRISVVPRPGTYIDPKGWGRQYLGGSLASARVGGSGFSAQYGYFEARMLVPAGKGTWPAFWMLPTSTLISDASPVAEVDAVEMYGHEPTWNCQSTHSYVAGKEAKNVKCDKKFSSDAAALGWHVYGAQVAPDGVNFYIDGKHVASAPQIPGGGEPMFFLADLALGGGWPVELQNVGNSAALYIDYIRVYN
jgi:hypothetical protein